MHQISELQDLVAALYQGTLKQGQRIMLKSYAYSLSFASFATLAGAAAATPPSQNLNINANADFLCTGISYRGQLASVANVSTKPAPSIRLLVTDSGNGEQWTNSAIDLELLASNDAKMRQLPYPRLVAGRTSLTVQLQGWSQVAESAAVDVVFQGVNVWIVQN